MFIKVEKKISGLENLQNSASVALNDVVHNITEKGWYVYDNIWSE
jgi:hypothetical protein